MTRLMTASTAGVLNPDAGRAHYSLARHPPAEDLSQFIERHWVVRWDLNERSFKQRLLPHPCVNLAVERDSATAAVHGIPGRLGSRTISGRGWVVGTKFRPGGFAPFTPIPMAELRDRAIALEDAFGRAAGDELRSRLSTAADATSRIAEIESFLREHLPEPDASRDLVMRIVGQMLQAPSDIRVRQLADRHGISTRTMQRLFRRYVGVSPKWVLRRYRLHEATERIVSGECRDLSDLAYDLGYTDQSHFNRDFHALIGITPKRYMLACVAAAGK